MSSASATRGQRFSRPGDVPPLRVGPYEGDELDHLRAEYAKGVWHEQDDRLRPRDRQVEENIRMLLGQQWIVWSELRQRYVDLSEHLSDDEKRWRHMPVLNRLFLWFILTHARLTENPPVIAWSPGPDQIDADLAEVMDSVWKHLWKEVGMLEVLDRAIAWLVPSGRVHLKTRIDPMKGEPIQAVGRAPLQLLGPDGRPVTGPDGNPIQRELDGVPLDENGDPRAHLTGDMQNPETMFTGAPHIFYEGGLCVDVLTCLEVRGSWGEHIPWDEKRQHIQRSLLSPRDFFETYGFEAQPDVRGEQAEDVGILYRMMHGSGLYGAAEQRVGANLQVGTDQEFVTVYELWEAPSRLEGMERTQESAGGRLLIVTGNGDVIRDGPRPLPFRYTSPIRSIDFVNLPGRPQGSSPQEMMNGPVRTRNRLYAQGTQHATRVANPIKVIDRESGIKEGDIPNIPGVEVYAKRTGNQPIIEFVAPGALGREVFDTADRMADEIDSLGSVTGSEGNPPTADSSGELVKELRFNSDRPLAAPARRIVTALGRMGEDWKVFLPIMWDQQKILRVVGDDNIARAITVWPELFREGNVNADPEIESMLPEGRGERQARMWRFWQSGVWGDPASPDAINTFLDQARFPHMSRATRPGGKDRATAEQNIGKLVQGVPAQGIHVFEWYDYAIHLHVLEQFLKGPEFLKLDPAIMQEMVMYRQKLLAGQQHAMMLQLQRELAMQAPMVQGQNALQAIAGGGGGEEEPVTESERPPEPVENIPSSPSSQAVGDVA